MVDRSHHAPTPTAAAWSEFQAALREVGRVDPEFGLYSLRGAANALRGVARSKQRSEAERKRQELVQ